MKKLLLLFLLFSSISFAQERTVNGIVIPDFDKEKTAKGIVLPDCLLEGTMPLEDYEDYLIEKYGKEPFFIYAKRIISNHLKENEPLWSDVSWDRWYTIEETVESLGSSICNGAWKYRVVYTIRSTVFDKIFFISHQKVIEERNFKLPEKY